MHTHIHEETPYCWFYICVHIMLFVKRIEGAAFAPLPSSHLISLAFGSGLRKPLQSRVFCGFWDKTTTNFQYIYHIAFWLLENSTTLLVPFK